jgi:hypothetical protein
MLFGGKLDNKPVIADLRNVLMHSGSFHGWEVLGSFQNSYLVL